MDRDLVEPTVTSLPGPKASGWVGYHQPTTATSTYVHEFVWDIIRDAVGPFCTDPNGNALLSFTSHVAAVPLGYNNLGLWSRLDDLDLVDPMKVAGQDSYVSTGGSPETVSLPGPAHLIDRLTDLIGHYGLDTMFLSGSRTEAVENAIKICYDACGTLKHGVTFDGAFHGHTPDALSLNRSKSVHRRKFPEVSDIHDVPHSMAGFETLRDELDSTHGYLPAGQVAFLILGPIQGGGGYHVPSETFMREVQTIYNKRDIPVIADETQSGVGRIGRPWAPDHYNPELNAITSAKALRVGATVTNKALFLGIEARLSLTQGMGDILASIQGTLTLGAIQEQDPMVNVTEKGTRFRSGPSRLVEWAPCLTDVRGLGLMTAIEFNTKDRRNEVLEAALFEELLTLDCGKRSLRLLPPFDVTDRELNLAPGYLETALDSVATHRIRST